MEVRFSQETEEGAVAEAENVRRVVCEMHIPARQEETGRRKGRGDTERQGSFS